MTVKELKTMEVHEVKDFIRKKLMYTYEEIRFISEEVSDPICIDLLDNIRPNLSLHHRFKMGEDHPDNDKILHFFDDLRLLDMFDYFKLTFYKGCGDLSWITKKDIWLAQVCDEPVYIQEQNLCGEGTVDIVYIIMSKVWTLKQH